MKKSTFLIIFLLFSLIGTPYTSVTAREVFVTDLLSFNAAVSTALPGDVIVMKNGVWRNVDLVFRGQGRSDAPITLKAESAGKVIISGVSSLKMEGTYLVVDGLYFKDGHSSKSLSLIEMRTSHSRVTNCAIVEYNKPVGTDVWISMFGFYNRVDHCHFEGKKSESVLIIIWRPEPDANYHRIDHNYFKNIPVIGLGGATAIRIGDGTHAQAFSSTTIENNFFEDMEGIGKVINIKSGGNIIRSNTFNKASGSITIRQGDNCLIENNYIFHGLQDRFTGGILVIGENHVIRNNYIEGTRSIGKGAIVLYEGQDNNAPGVGGYYPTKNVLIEGNLLVDNSKNIIIGQLYEPGTDVVVPVEGITYRNNTIVGNSSSNPVIDVIDPPVGDIVYAGNYFYQGNLGGLYNTSGITIADPQLYYSEADGYYKYSDSSPQKGNALLPPTLRSEVGCSFIILADTPLNVRLIKNDFLDGYNVGDVIETGDLSLESPLLNQWAVTAKSTERNGSNPVAEAPLTYDGYAESGKGVSFSLQSVVRSSVYGLADSNDSRYSPSAETPYYLAFMINIAKITTTLKRDFLWLDRDIGSSQGVQISLQKIDNTSYQIGIVEPGKTPVYYTTSLQMNETNLIVLKVTNEGASLFVNPTLGEAEPETPSASLPFELATRQSTIRSLVVRQMTGLTAQVGGFRFAYNWTEAAKKNTVSGFFPAIEKKNVLIKVSGKDIITEQAGKLTVYNMLGTTVLHGQTTGKLTTNLPRGIYVIHFKGEDGVHQSAKVAINF